MPRRAVRTTGAPAAIGPYSQAVRAGSLLFVSGQIPLDPATGALVDGGVTAQTHRVMQSLGAVLEAAGSGFDQVVRTTIYLTDLGAFSRVNEVYGSYFDAPAPARATVEVAALPKGAAVEIDAVADTGPPPARQPPAAAPPRRTAPEGPRRTARPEDAA